MAVVVVVVVAVVVAVVEVEVELVNAAEWAPKPVIRRTCWGHTANRGRPQFKITIFWDSSAHDE